MRTTNWKKWWAVLTTMWCLAFDIGGLPAFCATDADISAPDVVVVKKSKTAKTNYVYRTLQRSNLKDFKPQPLELDRYGGRTDLKGKCTGFFHTEKLGGRWLLVDPEGGVVNDN